MALILHDVATGDSHCRRRSVSQAQGLLISDPPRPARVRGATLIVVGSRSVQEASKTDQSQRDNPLVGVALKAKREQPNGFPRYRDKADVLSALVNQALEVRGLRLEPGQTLYSLRHTFEDRLTAVEAPE